MAVGLDHEDTRKFYPRPPLHCKAVVKFLMASVCVFEPRGLVLQAIF